MVYKLHVQDDVRLTFIIRDMARVSNGIALGPHFATIISILQVISVEHRNQCSTEQVSTYLGA